MPTSEMANVPAILDTVKRLRPASVLDLGIGFGKYGVLVREWTDIVHGRIVRDRWTTRLVGVEGFERYRNPIWEIYDQVGVENFADRENWPKYTGFDLVLLIDSLEHLERPTAEGLLAHLRGRNRVVIVSAPVGESPQGAVHGNEYERHRSTWLPQDFTSRGGTILFQGLCAVALFSA